MSRFVAAGASTVAVPAAETPAYIPPTTNDEWATAQIELDEKRRQKQDALSRSEQQSGQSLYETLQANKAAKQEAFEEASKLKHQFRALDDDEIDFLESVNEKQRAREAEVRKEEAERLKAFREQREKGADEEGAGGVNGSGLIEEVAWTAGGSKKRKKGKEGKDALRGLKVRRTSSTVIKEGVNGVKDGEKTKASAEEDTTGKSTIMPTTTNTLSQPPPVPSTTATTKTSAVMPAPIPALGLGLAAYSSDED